MNPMGFSYPLPINRFIRRQPLPAISMSSKPPDNSIARLQSLQRALSSRGKSLRAKGVRGKADEGAESERKLFEEVGLEYPASKEQHNPSGIGSANVEAPSILEITPSSTQITNSILKHHAQEQASPSSETSKPVKLADTNTSKTPAHITTPEKPPVHIENNLSKTINEDQKPTLIGEHSATVLSTALPIPQSTESNGDLSNVFITRFPSRLPWKAHSSSAAESEVVQYKLPLLEYFKSDAGFVRIDGSLPWLKRSKRRKPLGWQSSRSPGARKSVSRPPPSEHTKTNSHTPELPRNLKDAIVSDPKDPSFLISGSESNRFHVLSQRFAHLVTKRNIPVSEILVIAFPKKNANAIKEEIEGIIGNDLDSETRLPVRTFHSLCLGLLREYGGEIGLSADFEVCGFSDSTALLTPLVKALEGEALKPRDIKRYANLVSQLKHETNGEVHKTWLPATYRTVQKLREQYDSELRGMNQLDFADLVTETRRMLQDRPDVLDREKARFSHVLVDAFGGSSSAQHDIVSSLTSHMSNLFIVADSDESIFKPITNEQKESSSSSLEFEIDPHISTAEKQEVIESVLRGLNANQRDAVIADPNKACLVTAGPGSGKTRVLTHRFAYLVKAHSVSPSQILAVTFTNKAANEMKQRIEVLVGSETDLRTSLSIGTFHSICLKLLRSYGDRVGIPKGFDVCDTTDSRALLSRLIKKSMGVAPGSRSTGMYKGMISKLKNDTEDELRTAWQPFMYAKVEQLRELYDNELRRMNLVDFDDLLIETRRVLNQHPDVLEELRGHYRQVLVDEWQDTNAAQFDIVALLASKKNNLFVVGDVDQSIYKFRGADIKNIRKFHEKFKDALEVSLLQNYRSTQHIVRASQAVIQKNNGRNSREMMTMNDGGNKIQIHGVLTTKSEANFVARTVASLLDNGNIESLSDVGVLYRTNAQSRAFEQAFMARGLPYRVRSGLRFFERQEVKDIVSYLKVIANVDDDIAFRRVINVPPRGIGAKTVEDLERYAQANQCSLADALVSILQKVQSGDISAEQIGLRSSAAKKLADFYNLLYSLRKSAYPISSGADGSEIESEEPNKISNVGELVSVVVESTNYREYLQQRSDAKEKSEFRLERGVERIGNVEELRKYAGVFSNFKDFLDNVALVSESDRKESTGENNGCISMMTLHGGKGLEFPVVFIVGAEDRLIPMGRVSEDVDVEEERRLFYVGMTRAKSRLHISWRLIETAMNKGKVTAVQNLKRSRFLDDIPGQEVDATYEYKNYEGGLPDVEGLSEFPRG